MPKVAVERGHGAVTDHTIGIPDPVGLPGVRAARDACTGCHTGARGYPAGAPPLDAARLAKAFAGWWPRATPRPAWSKALASARRGDATAWAALERLARDTTAPRLVRASATSLLGRVPGGDPATLLEAAKHADSLVRRAAVSALASIRSEEADAALLAALSDPSAAVRARAARAAIDGWERVQANAALLDGRPPRPRREHAGRARRRPPLVPPGRRPPDRGRLGRRRRRLRAPVRARPVRLQLAPDAREGPQAPREVAPYRARNLTRADLVTRA